MSLEWQLFLSAVSLLLCFFAARIVFFHQEAQRMEHDEAYEESLGADILPAPNNDFFESLFSLAKASLTFAILFSATLAAIWLP